MHRPLFKLLRALTFSLIFTSCLQNNLVQPVDCSFSDLAITVEVTNTPCGLAQGQVEVISVGGELPLLYSINGLAVQSSPIFTGLTAGEYDLVVIEANDCQKVEKVTVNNVDGIIVSTMVLPSDCNESNGKIVITVSGGTQPYSYALDKGTAQSSNEFTLGPGDYLVTTSDENGCSFESNISILTNISYQDNVSPIIMASCAVSNCHNGSNPSRANFTNFTIVQANAPGIRSRTQNGSMPPNGNLTQAEKDAIACWVDDGALNN